MKSYRLQKGYIHVYTGDGKGKTTAAAGLALRAVRAGLRVFIAQFVKGSKSGEMDMLKKLSGKITIRQYGVRSFIKGQPAKTDRSLAHKGMTEVAAVVAAGRHDVVILDEMCVAMNLGLCELNQVLAMLNTRPAHVEIILTGRNAPRALINAADLITEMREIKHYFNKAVPARRGIEF
jgi:cob(I)alamin adenosyltransferase